MRLGILGGTFDPIHCGHLRMAEYCREKLQLDKIFFIPAGNPPHKKPQTPFDLRVQMLQLALSGYPYFEISELEKQEHARDFTYTYFTLKKLKKDHPDDELYFLMGEDNVPEISMWFKYNELLKLAKFIIISRPSDRKDRSHDFSFSGELSFLEMPKIDISSQCIRNMRSRGNPIHGLVPAKVEEFINNNNLYK